MTSPTKEDIALLRDSGVFDAEWYRSTYTDVGALRMDPAEHYLRYGQPMGRMSADSERVDISVVKKVQSLAAPAKGRALLEANEISQSGGDTLGLAYAKKYLPQEFAYTIETLRANAALRRKDEAGWLSHLNAYLGHYGMEPLCLTGAGALFYRLSARPLPPVTGGPLISVLMPAYNAERTVRIAAQSILNQTWRNIELLIVDDCSTDGTWAALQQIAATDDRVRILRNKVNVGPYVSKNIALMQSRGEWITGHDADDWAHPQRLDSHYARGADHRASLTYMLRMKLDGQFEKFTKIGDFSNDGVARIASISCLFERDFLTHTLGYWDTVRFGADSEMIARAKIALNSNLPKLETIGMVCLDLPNSLTNDRENGTWTAQGLSPIRKSYKDAWLAVHETLESTNCYLEFPQRYRRYEGNFDHHVIFSSLSEICEVKR